MKSSWNPWTVENWSVPESEWNDPTLPMVTLGVLSYNRREELRQTLDVLLRAVEYPCYEILVVDNGSTDGTIPMVQQEFPSVILHEVGKNAGVASRNLMPSLARGKYLFSFDDDSFPGTPTTVLRIVQHMEAYPEMDAISCLCYQPLSGITETRTWEFYRLRNDLEIGFMGLYIVEGGICFRRKSLLKVKGYEDSWGYGCEGMDLGLQFFKAKLNPYLCPWFVTLHRASSIMRPPGRRAYSNSRQMIWMIAKHWPAIAAYPLLALVVIRRLVALAMHRETATHNLKGLRDGFRGIRPFLEHRPKLTARQVLALKRFYLFVFRWA